MTQDTPMEGPPGGPGEPSEEELRAALEEQMRNITVEDVLLQTVVTLVNLAGRRLGLGVPPEEAAAEIRPDQARMAIDGVRALLPLVPGDVEPIRQALTQLQMAYAQVAGARGAGAAEPEPGAPAPGPADPGGAAGDAAGGGGAAGDDPDRAKARAKLWTPPGT